MVPHLSDANPPVAPLLCLFMRDFSSTFPFAFLVFPIRGRSLNRLRRRAYFNISSVCSAFLSSPAFLYLASNQLSRGSNYIFHLQNKGPCHLYFLSCIKFVKFRQFKYISRPRNRKLRYTNIQRRTSKIILCMS